MVVGLEKEKRNTQRERRAEGETGECVCVAWPVDLLAASGFGLQSSSTSTMPWWMVPIN